jgi:hypothetical protein
MIDHFRADANLHFELDARMESDEATKRRRQRSAGDLLHHAESHPARKARCGEAITGYFLKLQQTTRITEQHFTVIGEPDTARRAPEQWTLGLELEALDLLTNRRLRQVEPLGRAVETTAVSNGDKGAQQLEIQHANGSQRLPAYPPSQSPRRALSFK